MKNQLANIKKLYYFVNPPSKNRELYRVRFTESELRTLLELKHTLPGPIIEVK
jgi:hypothetical protein